jgi:hypothetical protein
VPRAYTNSFGLETRFVCCACVFCVCECARVFGFVCGVFLWFFKRTLRKYDYRYPVSPHNQPKVPLLRYDEFGASKDSNIVTAKGPFCTHTLTHTHITHNAHRKWRATVEGTTSVSSILPYQPLSIHSCFGFIWICVVLSIFSLRLPDEMRRASVTARSSGKLAGSTALAAAVPPEPSKRECYMSVSSDGGKTWNQRFASLTTKSGLLQLYAEKSG